MNIHKKRPSNSGFIPAAMVLATLATSAHAASITQGTVAFLHSQNGGFTTHNVSVFAGSAGYAGHDAAGTATSGTFGDGTVTAYNFWTAAAGGDGLFKTGDESIISYAESGGLITGGSTDTSLDRLTSTSLWTTTDPAGFTSAADFSSNTNAAELADFSGSIDISGLSSGSIYFMFGSYRGGNVSNSTATLTMKTGGLETLAPVNVTANDLANNWEQYMVEATFVNDVGADEIAYSFGFNGNGRVTGVVVDGVAAAIPEPSSVALLGLGALGFLLRRRR